MPKTYGEIDAQLSDQLFVKLNDHKLWSYVRRRFIAFWADRSPNRHIPRGYFDVERQATGWFFPAKWVRDFGHLAETAEPPQKPEESEDMRVARTERANDSMATAHKPSWFEQQSTTELPSVEEAAEPSPELKAALKRKWHIMGGDAPAPEI